MNPAWPLAISIFLLSTLLAGCLGGDDLPGETPEATEEPDDGLGTVTGRILTVNLDPVQRASVRLVEGSTAVAEDSTDEEGRFMMRNVEPGEYRLQVSATCCRENVRAVTVTADEVTTVDLQLELFSSDDLQVPRVEQFEWTGFLVCSVATPVVLASACSAVDAVLDAMGQDPVTDDDFIHPFEVQPGVRTLVGGMSWRAPGAALGDELRIVVEREGHPDLAPNYINYARAAGHSPLEFRVDAGHVINNYGEDLHPYDFYNLEDTLGMWYRIFGFGDVNLVYQQQFTVYWDLYYWDYAPEDATALPDI